MKHRQMKYQNGVVLIVSLVILLVMTILGVTAMQSTVLEEKMAGNFRDRHLAFQAAEATLRNGETWILSLGSAPIPDSSGTNGVVIILATAPSTWSWSSSGAGFATVSGMEWTSTTTERVITSSPRRLIEEVKFVNDGDITIGTSQAKEGNMQYRITARGTGGTDNAIVMAQSVFSRRY